jgi:DNA-binding CsgD family transcriptional regulator
MSRVVPMAIFDRVRDAVIEAERRRRSTEEDAEARALFLAIVEGRCTVVDRFEGDGRRFLVARENPRECRRSRSLSRREREIFCLTIEGRSVKSIAFELGVTPATAAAYLACARRKSGLLTRAEMVRWFAHVTRDEGAGR